VTRNGHEITLYITCIEFFRDLDSQESSYPPTQMACRFCNANPAWLPKVATFLATKTLHIHRGWTRSYLCPLLYTPAVFFKLI